MKKTLYEVLGIGVEASQQEIEGAYQALVTQLKNSTDADYQDEMNLVKMSYSILSDPKKRSQYDQSLELQPPISHQPKSVPNLGVLKIKQDTWLVFSIVSLMVFLGLLIAADFIYKYTVPILSLLGIVYMVLVSMLISRLSKDYPEIYEDLGKPRLSRYGVSGKLLLFLFYRQHRKLNDGYLSLLSDGAALIMSAMLFTVISMEYHRHINPKDSITSMESWDESGYAKLTDSSALPTQNKFAIAAYEKFLTDPIPRVFLICEDQSVIEIRGANIADPLHNRKSGCEPYAINNRVVWVKK